MAFALVALSACPKEPAPETIPLGLLEGDGETDDGERTEKAAGSRSKPADDVILTRVIIGGEVK